VALFWHIYTQEICVPVENSRGRPRSRSASYVDYNIVCLFAKSAGISWTAELRFYGPLVSAIPALDDNSLS